MRVNIRSFSVCACVVALAALLGMGIAFAKLEVFLVAIFALLLVALVRFRSRYLQVSVEAVQTSVPMLLVLAATSYVNQSAGRSVVLLSMIAAYALMRLAGRNHERRVGLPALGLGAMIVLNWSHGGASKLEVVTGLLVMVIIVASIRRDGVRSVAISAFDGVGVYLLISVLTYVGGFHSPSLAVRVGGLQNSFGLTNHRVVFPLENSFVIAPIMAATYIAALPGLGWGMGLRRLWRVFVLILCIGVILAAGYRGPLVIALVLFVATYLGPRVVRLLAVPVAVVALTVPFWSAATLSANSTVSRIESITPLLSRSDSSSVLDGRDLIWHDSGYVFWGQTRTQEMLGRGVNASATSGAAEAYSEVASGLYGTSAVLSGPNSSLVEEAFDGGAIGVALLLVATAGTAWRFRRRAFDDRISLSMLSACVALMSTGATETTLVPGSPVPEPFWLILILASCAVASFGGRDDLVRTSASSYAGESSGHDRAEDLSVVSVVSWPTQGK